jgi:hypothetical protein
MSYRNQQNGNVTMIDDLPDIEDLDPHQNQMEMSALNMLPPAESSKYQKYIRNNNNYNPHQNSGMNSNTIQTYDPYKVGYHNMNQGSYIDSLPMQQMRNYHQFQQQNYPMIHSSGGLAPNSQQFYEPYESPKSHATCLDLADHAENCPVCIKIYNNDKTVYIIVIVILCIICILLLKRILDL